MWAHKSSYALVVNDNNIKDDEKISKWLNNVSNIRVELNQKSLDVATIKLNLTAESSSLDPLCVEGDYIDIFIYRQGDITLRELVFSGVVKTIIPEFEDGQGLTIEAYDELFLLDFNDSPLEVEAGQETGEQVLNEMADITNIEDYIDEISEQIGISDLAEEMKFNDIFTFPMMDGKEKLTEEKINEANNEYIESYAEKFLKAKISPDEKTQIETTTLSDYLRKIKNRYPELIKKIYVHEIDYVFDVKQLESSGLTDYKKLQQLAIEHNRTLFMKKGILYFIKTYEELTEPFIYNPPMFYDVDDSFTVRKVTGHTTLSGVTENLRVYSMNNKGVGEIVSDFQGNLNKSKISIDINENLINKKIELERQRQKLNKFKGTSNYDKQKSVFDDFSMKYNELLEESQEEFSGLVEDLNNNKQYGYDIVSSFNNGSPIREYRDNNIKDQQTLEKVVKERLKRNENKLVSLNISLKYGNTRMRPFQRLTLLIFDQSGKCAGYCKRLSGMFEVKKVLFEIGNSGFNTDFELERNYLIEV